MSSWGKGKVAASLAVGSKPVLLFSGAAPVWEDKDGDHILVRVEVLQAGLRVSNTGRAVSRQIPPPPGPRGHLQSACQPRPLAGPADMP